MANMAEIEKQMKTGQPAVPSGAAAGSPGAGAWAQAPAAPAGEAVRQTNPGEQTRAGVIDPGPESRPDPQAWETVRRPSAQPAVPSAAQPAAAGGDNLRIQGVRLNEDGTLSPLQAQPSAGAGAAAPGSLQETIAGIYGRIGGMVPTEEHDYSGQIEDIYQKMLDAQRIQLDAGHEATLRELEAAAAKIPGLYQQQGNALAGQNEMQRRAFAEQAAASGLNTGAGGQAALAQSAAYLGGQAQIRQAQADAQAELERQRVNIEAEYQTAIAQALADNDYQKAVALMQEMQRRQQEAMQIAQMQIGLATTAAGAEAGAAQADWQHGWQQEEQDYNKQLQQAQILASYGDFSGFEALYGKDAADYMHQIWLYQNPDFAVALGQMTPEQYQQLTGGWPGGGGGGSGGGSGAGTAAAGETGAAGGVSQGELQQLMDLFRGAQTAADIQRIAERIPDSYVEQLNPQQRTQLAGFLQVLQDRKGWTGGMTPQ